MVESFYFLFHLKTMQNDGSNETVNESLNLQHHNLDVYKVMRRCDKPFIA